MVSRITIDSPLGNQVLKRLLTGAIRLNGDQPKTWYAKRGGRTAVARDFMSIKRPLYSELMTDEVYIK